MKQLLLPVFLLLATALCAKDNLPDSIVAVKSTYVYVVNLEEAHDSLYQTRKKITNKRVIRSLIDDLNSLVATDKSEILPLFGIDTSLLKTSNESLLDLYSGNLKFEWNKHQKEHILKELGNVDNYIEKLYSYLSPAWYYVGRDQYTIYVYKDSELISKFSSRVGEYKIPYENENNGDLVFNYKLDVALNKWFKVDLKLREPLQGDRLLRHLVTEIIGDNFYPLYQLAAYSYFDQIDELKTDFSVLAFGEHPGRGRYIGSSPKTIKVTLHNDYMPDSVNIQLMLSQVGNTIYSRDSIKNDYKYLIDRIRDIDFLMSYLEENEARSLDIYYFNNKPINKYSIESVNKDSIGWAEQDKYIESFKWYENNNIKPTFDIQQAIKTSERHNCGCNFRFTDAFIEKAIVFELFDEIKRGSMWLLLTDDTILLYIAGGEVHYGNVNLGTASNGTWFPCKLFDKKGNILN